MQILSIPITDSRKIPHRIKRRYISEENLQEFFLSLNQVTWQEVYEKSDINIKCSIFIDLFLHYYNNAFPIKTVCVRDKIKNNWITQIIKISSKKMRVLDKERRQS